MSDTLGVTHLVCACVCCCPLTPTWKTSRRIAWPVAADALFVRASPATIVSGIPFSLVGASSREDGCCCPRCCTPSSRLWLSSVRCCEPSLLTPVPFSLTVAVTLGSDARSVSSISSSLTSLAPHLSIASPSPSFALPSSLPLLLRSLSLSAV